MTRATRIARAAAMMVTALACVTACGSTTSTASTHSHAALPARLAGAVSRLSGSSFGYQLVISESPALEGSATGSGITDPKTMAGTANLHLGSHGHTADLIFQSSSSYLKVSTGSGKWALFDAADITGSSAGQIASSLLSTEYLNAGFILQAVSAGTTGATRATQNGSYILTVSLKQAVNGTSPKDAPAYYRGLTEMLLYGQLSTATEGDYDLRVTVSVDSSGNLKSMSFRTPSPGMDDIAINIEGAVQPPSVTPPAKSDITDPAAASGGETEKKLHDGDAS